MRFITIAISLLFLAINTAMGQPWTEHLIASNLDGVLGVHAADFDNDGDVDVVTAASELDEISWWENDAGSWIQHVIATTYDYPSCVNAADIDLDGDNDILVASQIDGKYAWWENMLPGWSEHILATGYVDAYNIESADLDGDGDIDIVGTNWEYPGGGTALWWEQTPGGWQEHVIGDAALGCTTLHPIELDGDGDVDIVAAKASEHKWYNNELNELVNRFTSSTILSPAMSHTYDVHGGDLNGDGIAEPIYGGTGGTIWYERIDNTWIQNQVSAISSYHVHCIDIDDDGDNDVLTSEWGQGEFVFNQRVGDGWSRHVISTGNGGAHCIHAGDIDGDGDLDVIGAAPWDGNVFWWEQPGSPYVELDLISPNGSEAWRINTPHDIEWISSSPVDVTIELLQDHTLERVIVPIAQNNNMYEWLIPDDVVPGDNYQVRIALFDGIEADTSDAPFAITSLPTVSVYPHLPPVVIPPEGNGFWYWFEIANPSPFPGSGNYWTEVVIPNGYVFGPLEVLPRTLGPWEVFAPAQPTPQWIPGYAPAGVYEYVMHVGIYPNLIVATDSFEFEKLPGAHADSLPVYQWTFGDWQSQPLEKSSNTTANHEQLTVEFLVSRAYPNPFNSSTTLTVSLPLVSHLEVTVYDILGRLVAELASGQYATGEHKLTLKSNGLASGLYILRTEVPGHLNQTQKLLLVR